MCSFGTPAAPKRSSTWLSTPQVIGLTKPSGGGGEYAALVLRICATSVGSFGIQLPITMRPPGRVTRTISFATSKGLGANMAPKMLTTRSNMSSASPLRLHASPSWKRRFVRPCSCARRFPASTRLRAMSTPNTSAPRRAAGSAVVPSPQPRSSTLSPGFTPRLSTTASPLSRMLCAMRVKSPFSQSALFRFMRARFVGFRFCSDPSNSAWHRARAGRRRVASAGTELLPETALMAVPPVEVLPESQPASNLLPRHATVSGAARAPVGRADPKDGESWHWGTSAAPSKNCYRNCFRPDMGNRPRGYAPRRPNVRGAHRSLKGSPLRDHPCSARVPPPERTGADRPLARRRCSGVSVLERDLDALRSGLRRDPLTRRMERDSDALRVSHGRDAGAPANRAARLHAGVGALEVVELLDIGHLARRLLARCPHPDRREAADLERVPFAPVVEHPVSPRPADARCDLLRLDANRGGGRRRGVFPLREDQPGSERDHPQRGQQDTVTRAHDCSFRPSA